MSLFSQTKGIRPIQKTLQYETMDEDLRNRLWSVLDEGVCSYWDDDASMGLIGRDANCLEELSRNYWLNFFKKPTDTRPTFKNSYGQSAHTLIRAYFFKMAWHEVYDWIEFTAKNIPRKWSNVFKTNCNHFLQDENAAYRFVGDEIVEITDDHEIEAIESAIDRDVSAVSSHLSRSLELLSDKQNPDYRNSIKESISAVEALCRIISCDDKATLGAALKKVDEAHPMHNAFKEALNKLYGFTSDHAGIRHSLLEDATEPSYADAKFLLVSCAAFTNFLWTKAAENRLSFNHQTE